MLLDGVSSQVYRWLACQLTILHCVSLWLTECVCDSRLSIQVVKKQVSQQLADSISRQPFYQVLQHYQHKFCNSHELLQQCDGQRRQYRMATDSSSATSSNYGAYAKNFSPSCHAIWTSYIRMHADFNMCTAGLQVHCGSTDEALDCDGVVL